MGPGHIVLDRACRGIPGMCAKPAYGPGLQCVQSSHPVAHEGNYLQLCILACNSIGKLRADRRRYLDVTTIERTTRREMEREADRDYINCIALPY